MDACFTLPSMSQERARASQASPCGTHGRTCEKGSNEGLARRLDVPHPIRNVAEEERDRHMFNCIEALVEATPNARILVYCGSSHGARCGILEYPTRTGDRQSIPTLGALLSRRYPGKVVSVAVLFRYDPMWWQVKNDAPFNNPVVIPTSSRWPDVLSLGLPLWQLPRWDSGSPGSSVSAKAVFDYLVWWPTSRAGTRGQ